MKPKRVLVVGVHQNSQLLLTDYLSFHGYEAHGFPEVDPDSSAYFPYLTHFQPHLIVLSLGLPDNIGFCFLEQTKQKLEFKHIPVVVLAPNAPQVVEEWVIGLGASRYLRSPFEPDRLLSAIQAVLGEAKNGV